MNNEKEIYVSICCVTYNHATYIRQCLEGFLMQTTNFRFEIIIHDDCSTDGTTEIVKEYVDKYPDLIVPIIQPVNQYQNGVKSIIATFMFPKAKGKYIAICEGDDYWTDPLKLQKQVDIMESKPDVSLVYTSFKTVDENNIEIRRPRYESFIKRSYSGNLLPELFYSNFILTLTAMLRREVFSSVMYKNCPVKFDYTIFFASAFLGEGYFMPTITGCYRKCAGSAITSHHEEVVRDSYENYRYFIDYFLRNSPVIYCNMIETSKIYRNMMVNMFFNNDYKMIKKILKKNIYTCLLVPESFIFSLLKKLKWKTYGSIDR